MYSEKIIEKLKDKNIAILGFGREGKSTYNFIRKHLPEKHLTIIDKANITCDDLYVDLVTGDDYLNDLGKYDLIIKTPGISLKDIDYSDFKDSITSQLELLLEVDRENIIGITGTKGKSTTSTLMYEVLRGQRDNVYLLGNIGIPVLDKIEEYTDSSLLVIEMSSHQLEFIKHSPHIAAILNLFQDHLDHAGSLEHYHNNKMNIFKYQTGDDFAIYSDDNVYLNNKMKEFDIKSNKYNVRFDMDNVFGNSVRTDGKHIYINGEDVYTDGERKLIGDHNLKNIMFVLTISKILGLDLEKARNVILNFVGLKYRMEYLGIYHDIKYYSDTIATIPDATMNAVKAIKDVDTLIFGGLDRGIDYTGFIEFLKNSSINNLICMPSTGTKIGHVLEKESNKNIKYADTLEEANELAILYTKKGMSCLLSPSAASYEYFKNFEEKGDAFEKVVKKM